MMFLIDFNNFLSESSDEFSNYDVYLLVGYTGNKPRYDLLGKYNKENNKFLASDITYDPVRHDTYLYIDDGVSEEEFISEKKATNEHERLKIYNAFVKEQKEKTPLERKEDRIRYDRIRWMKNQNMSREQIKTELERIEKEDARKKQTTTAKGGNLRKTKKRNSL